MTGLDRRSALAMTLAGTLIGRARAAPTKTETMRVWQGEPPGGDGLTVRDEWVRRSPGGDPDDIAWPHVATPTLTIHRPVRPNGAAILVIPGGGYRRVALERGGSAQARLLAARGYIAADLLYRLPHDGWAAGPDAPLQDAQRAIRLMRARAPTWGVDPRRVAAIGFSAGGHLAARLGSRANSVVYPPADAADRLSARPAVLGLFFPVVTLSGPFAHRPSRDELLGASANETRARDVAADAALPADMPPTYIACAADDPVVPYINSVTMFTALRAAGVAAELSIYERGGHGLPPPGDGTAIWPDGVLAFARRHGL